MPSELKQVPASACCLDVGPMEFVQADGNRIKLLARTGQPINHWYWGRVVHDLAGMTHKPRIPLDYLHDDEQIVGFANEFDVSSNDLHVTGQLTPFTPDDRASEILHKGRAGVPYEASIDFRGGGLRVEELDDGMSAEVNGYTFSGPGKIIREWPLQAIAVCPHGADGGASTQFNGQADTIGVTVFKRSEGMPNVNEEIPEELAEPKPPAVEPKPPAVEPEDVRNELNSQLRKYVMRFGAENGAKWFSGGKDFVTALDLHLSVLETQLAAEEAKCAALAEKLASLDRGEQEGVEFQDSPTKDEKQTREMALKVGDGLAEFAGSLKIPSKN